MREIIITTQTAGGRLDKLLFKYLDKADSGFVYKMLRKKNITLNDKKADGNIILNPGDSIKMYLAEETIEKFHSGSVGKEANGRNNHERKPAQLDELQIVFEDDNILAINKPSGLLSQRSKTSDVSANDFVLEHIKGTEVFKPGIANRLDRNTSGIILAGKNPASARELSRAIRDKDISKKYLALVCGKMTKNQRSEAWLYKDRNSNIVRISDKMVKDADHIETGFSFIAGTDSYTLVEAELFTGKSHQIRAQLAYLGYPIAGDPKYGNKAVNTSLRDKYGLKDQLLHAYKVEFRNMQGILEYLNGVSIEARIPDFFALVLNDIGIKY